MIYSFDTSALLNGRRDLLPPAIFPTLWERLEMMIGSSVLAVDQVRDELRRKHDETTAWAAAQRDLFVPLESDIQRATRQVLTECPKLVAVGGKRDGADPFVVALALARGGMVVTEENSGSAVRPRIPDACDLLGVPCVGLVGFVQAQGWQF